MEVDVILSQNISKQPQLPGSNKIIQEFFVKINVTGMIPSTETRNFLLELTVTTPGQQYQVTNILSPADIDDEGFISMGTLYLLGPITEDQITYSAIITYINV